MSPERTWIKVGEDPYRYEDGRENPDPAGPLVTDQLAYVEEEKHSPYFRWETYTDPHEEGAAPDVEAAQEKALEALQKHGVED